MWKPLSLAAAALVASSLVSSAQCPFMGMRQGIMSNPCSPAIGVTNNLMSARLDNVNCQVTLRTVSTRGTLDGIYLLGVASLITPIPIVAPCNLVIDPVVILAAPRGTVTLPIPPSLLAGRIVIYGQGIFFDQQPPRLNQIIVTNGVAMQFV